VPDQFAPCHCFPDQINAIYPFTRGWTETYPDEVDPGMATLRDSVELLLGIEIDFYALVNMSGFVRVVDALGGVRVYVTSSVHTEVSPAREGENWIEAHIRPGWRRLNGHQALAYVRERKTSSDYVRMTRQRCMLKAVAASADPVTIVTRFASLSRAVKSSVRTDIPLNYVPTLVAHAASLDFGDIVTVGFTPPEFAPTANHRNQPIPDLAAIRAKVQEILTADPATLPETSEESECRI
jgi:LCP family protein required for cell wall assembly